MSDRKYVFPVSVIAGSEKEAAIYLAAVLDVHNLDKGGTPDMAIDRTDVIKVVAFTTASEDDSGW
jgi:hypothetical protein